MGLIRSSRAFEKALKGKGALKTSEGAIVGGLLALSDAVIKTKNEKALIEFLNENRGNVTLDPYKMNKYTPLFLKMASDAMNKKMFSSAFTLYGLIPSTKETIEDINAKIGQLPNSKGIVDRGYKVDVARLKADCKKLEAKRRQVDVEIAEADPEDFTPAMRMGGACALNVDPRRTYWGVACKEAWCKKNKWRYGCIDEGNLVRKSGS